MQETIIHYHRNSIASATRSGTGTGFSGGARSEGSGITRVVLENPIIVFAREGCCMCHVVKRLLLGHGVNIPVYEVEEKEEDDVVEQLLKMNNRGGGVVIENLPAVVVGGKLLGGLERIMASHISGELVPILKDAGVLWL